tara:strand:+ start:266 stop:550 length:285 start_codon:yes stop_codon:yes gene_type:complete
MPVNVICPILGTPVDSHLWCFKRYSFWAHTVIRQSSVSAVLDTLLKSKNEGIKWEVRSVVATIQQIYPHAFHDPRLRELVERHDLEEYTYKGGV